MLKFFYVFLFSCIICGLVLDFTSANYFFSPGKVSRSNYRSRAFFQSEKGSKIRDGEKSNSETRNTKTVPGQVKFKHMLYFIYPKISLFISNGPFAG